MQRCSWEQPHEVITVNSAETSLNDTNPQVGGELSTQELIDLPEVTSTHGANEFLITKTFAGVSSTSQDYSNVNNLSLGGGRPSPIRSSSMVCPATWASTAPMASCPRRTLPKSFRC